MRMNCEICIAKVSSTVFRHFADMLSIGCFDNLDKYFLRYLIRKYISKLYVYFISEVFNYFLKLSTIRHGKFSIVLRMG